MACISDGQWSHDENRQTNDLHTNMPSIKSADKESSPNKNVKKPAEYVLEEINKYIGQRTNKKYIVHQYGFGSRDDTVELPDHISKH